MRLLSFGPRGRERAGVLLGDRILDLERLSRDWSGGWRRLLERGCLEPIRAAAADPDRLDPAALLPAAAQRLGPPIPDAGKVICLGRNYVDHAAEQGAKVPERPLLFAKATSALAGPRDDIVVPPGVTHVDYEVELAVVIGRRGSRVPEDRAADLVLGYMALNDVTARKLQKDEGQWFRGKSPDTFGPCGPAIVTADEIPDPHALAISLQVNGETRQEAGTGQMFYRIPFLIAHITSTMTLDPGDVISTGTPGGVGVFRDPPVFLRDGDVVVARVERIGELVNRVREER